VSELEPGAETAPAAPRGGQPPGSTRSRSTRRRRRAGGVVAVAGIHTSVARRLLRRLEEDDRYLRLVLLDVRAPSLPLRKASFHKIDFTEPLADAQIADVLRCEGVETLVHLALREVPDPRPEEAHELETAGTLYLLNAAADCITRASPLSKLVTVTTTMVYGADARNPNFLRETHPLQGGSEPGFVRDKVSVEEQCAGFRRERGLPVCVLRPCWTLGPRRRSIAGRLLASRVCFSVMGFDPLIQLLHQDDLDDAVKRVVDGTYDGAFNIVGNGVLPVSSLFKLAGRPLIPLPAPLAYPLTTLLWRSYGIGAGVSLDFLRHLWVADGEHAAERLQLKPRYATREVVQSFVAHL
jgi:UDP-glucose 4-epimerase